jgi:hypothetical protein
MPAIGPHENITQPLINLNAVYRIPLVYMAQLPVTAALASSTGSSHSEPIQQSNAPPPTAK